MLKFLCKLVNLARSYKRKHKGMFFSEHSVWGREWRDTRYCQASKHVNRPVLWFGSLHFAWGVTAAKCILVTRTRICLRLSVPRHISTLLNGPGCNLGEWYGCPLVVHYWADLQSVQGFHCYDNTVPNAKCQRVLVVSLCLVKRAVKLMSHNSDSRITMLWPISFSEILMWPAMAKQL